MTHSFIPWVIKYIGLSAILLLCNCVKMSPDTPVERSIAAETKAPSVVYESEAPKTSDNITLSFEVINNYADKGIVLEVHDVVFNGAQIDTVMTYPAFPQETEVILPYGEFIQSRCSIDVTYTMYQEYNHFYIAYNYTERFNLRDIDGGCYTWQKGFRYDYKIAIKLYEIKFNPMVGSWDDQTGTDNQ